MSAEEVCPEPNAEHSINLQLPPPGIGLKEIDVPSGSGSSIRIVLKPETGQTQLRSHAQISGGSLSAAGFSFLTITVVKSDGSIWSTTLDRLVLDTMVQDLNRGRDFSHTATLTRVVPGAPGTDNLETTSVDIEGRVTLLVNGSPVGTIRWGYDLSPIALQSLATHG